MTTEQVLQLAGIMSSVLIAGFTLLGIIIQRNSEGTRRKVEEVRLHINSRMDEMLALTAQASLAQGRLEGAQSEKDTVKAMLDQKRTQGQSS